MTINELFSQLSEKQKNMPVHIGSSPCRCVFEEQGQLNISLLPWDAMYHSSRTFVFDTDFQRQSPDSELVTAIKATIASLKQLNEVLTKK